MALVLNEEQESLVRTVRELCTSRAADADVRALRDSGTRFHPELWALLGEMGLRSLTLPERDGGSGLGVLEGALVMAELGRKLIPTPLLPSLLAGRAVSLGEAARPREALVPLLLAGPSHLAFAHEESDFHSRDVRAEILSEGDGYRLTGQKTFVPEGPGASALLVSARGPRGIVLVVVPPDAAGVTITPLSLVDERGLAAVRFSSVPIAKESVLIDAPQGERALGQLLDSGAVLLAAEMLGGAEEAFARTVDYLKERRQFGVAIGSFQALKHRAAQMYCQLALSRSSVLAAATALDEGAGNASLLASAAKARLSSVFLHVTAEGIQMHGGIGVTDEHDIGLFYKRARVAEMAYGDAAFHADRFATLSGY